MRMQLIEQHICAEPAPVANIISNDSQRGQNNPRRFNQRGNNQRGGYIPRGGYNQREGYSSQTTGNYNAPSTNMQRQPFRGRYNAGRNFSTDQRESRPRTSMQQYNPRYMQQYNTQRSTTPYSGQNVQRTRSEEIDLTRFPQPVFPHRMDLCFYHRVFGKDAKKHELPCQWVFPANNK